MATMDTALEEHDPYVLTDLKEPSYFTLQPLQSLETPDWNADLPDLSHGVYKLPTDLFSKNESSLYQLNVFNLESLEADAPSEPAVSSSTSQVGDDNDQEGDYIEFTDDVWTLNTVSKPTSAPLVLRSWDTFPKHETQKAAPTCLSEAGPRGYDAALAYQASQTGLEDSGRVAQTGPFIASLFRLGLGWNSIFFQFNEQTRRFEKDIKDARISGISLVAIDGLIEELLYCGTQVRRIRRFIRAVPHHTDSPAPLSSLARAAFILLHGYEELVSERFELGPSLLQTEMLFRRASCLLKALAGIIASVENSRIDGEVISLVFTQCDHFSHQFVWLTDILHEIMALVSEPWLSLVESWIGLRPEPATLIEFDRNGNGFIDTGYVNDLNTGSADAHVGDFSFRPKAMPIFVPPDHVEAIFESGKSLRLLKSFRSHHPLVADGSTDTSLPLSLQRGVSWDDINRIREKANEYEDKLRAEILRYHNSPESYAKTKSKEDGKFEEENSHPSINDVFSLFDLDEAPAESTNSSAAVGSHKLRNLLDESRCIDYDELPKDKAALGPPLAASVYLSIAPAISAQSRLINFSCLHLLFNGHKVLEHLRLQWRFQLLGDGIFSSRLSHVLFDPDMHSGERKRGIIRGGSSTGLRLGSRDTWPPASSELRLVLSGLLSDCYAGGPDDQGAHITDRDLPGGLSFSIRDLSEEELLQSKDPDSVQALDFLRLQYGPAPVLATVITPRSLRRYDRLFKHLLRLLRMQSVAQGLVRDSTGRSNPDTGRSIIHKFRFEALHFVEAVSDYCFHIGIGQTWAKFDKTLLKIENCVERGDFDGAMKHAKGLHHLRSYHEDVLDQMLYALLLSRRHAQANKLLEDIFGVILSFAPISKLARDGIELRGKSTKRAARQLYATFRKKVSSFIRFLKALDGVKGMRLRGKHLDLAAWGSGHAADIDINGVFEHLLIRLDLMDYY